MAQTPTACPDCGGRGWTVRTGACSCLVQRLAAAERMIATLQAEVERLRRSGHDVES